MDSTIDATMLAGTAMDLKRVLPAENLRDPRVGADTEWLVTNGRGGYCSGTVSGDLARRYHGLLVAALAAPLGRVVMLSALGERVRFPDGRIEWLTGGDLAGNAAGTCSTCLEEFRLDLGLPYWRFRLPTGTLEKRVFMVYAQNTVLLRYRYDGDAPLRLSLRPFLAPRPHETPLTTAPREPGETVLRRRGLELRFPGGLPTLQVTFNAPHVAFTSEPSEVSHTYVIERDRGYDHEGVLWSPGYLRCDLRAGEVASMLVSTEGWEIASALPMDDIEPVERDRRRQLLVVAGCDQASTSTAELVLAADQFVVTPSWRVRDMARARAEGVDPRSVVAGYHWFTDWGRDTMISLEGLTLDTGRKAEARAILLNFAHSMKDGLIPNLFPERDQAGLYHTADATLWMFHAVHRYVARTGDTSIIELLLPALQSSVERHLAGTLFNIHVDSADGLLAQGEAGYQLTWMDAKVDGWVVTPRRGKAVEINALWYNALRLVAEWAGQVQGTEQASTYGALADRVFESFNRRFWYTDGGYLYDVVDGESGDDSALRPNQVFAIALEHPVLTQERWQPVMDVVERELLTPVGLRSLAPQHPDFKPQYYGDLRSRDAAYHQGTVWAWLIGPFVDAWIKLHPDRAGEARRFLSGLIDQLGHAGLGTISEIFDAMPPYTPRGCIAQAWSVAEVLRTVRAIGAEQS